MLKWPHIILALPLLMVSISAWAQTAPPPVTEKPKATGFVSPDGSVSSVLTQEQKQASDDAADEVFQNEMKLRIYQSKLAVLKAQAEIAKLGPELNSGNSPVIAATVSSVTQPEPMVTSAIPARVNARPDKPKPDINLEDKVKILTIIGPVDQLVATLLIDRLGSIQVKKNDAIPNFNMTVFDIDRRKVGLKTVTGEIIYIPFIR